MFTASLLLALQIASPQAGAQERQAIKDLVEVEIHSPAEHALLLDLCSDVDDHHGFGLHGHAVVYATDAEQALLTERGFEFEVEIEDLASFYEERARLSQGRMSVGSMGGFRTLSEIHQEMDRLAAAHPTLVSQKFSIGQSLQGREIYAMRISTSPSTHDPAKPVAWFDALHHAREPMGGESLLQFANHLATNFGVDDAVTRIVETRNVLLIPCVNPDGYEYNRQTNPNGGGMWRKNRRGGYGVDLNRNYAHEWGSQWGGSSGSQGSETYRGSAPFSEPETQAIRDLLALQVPGMSVSAHTYSDLWIYPWGYDTVFTTENQQFRNWSAEQTEANGWVYGTAWEVLYTANGVSVDYQYDEHGTYAFTPEIGNNGDGFWPDPNRIPALTADSIPPYMLVAQWTGSWADLIDLSWTEISGNGDAYPEPGESWAVQPVVRNYGAITLLGTATLGSSNGLITVTSGASSMNIGQQASQALSAFTVSFDAALEVGELYSLDLSLDYEGHADLQSIDFQLGRPRVLFADDMQSDTGWTSNNNTNWSWERADPQQTTTGGQIAQPNNDNPNGSGTLAWVTGASAGGSVGTNDVDGTARLTSPRFAAGEFDRVELEYARWFANLPGSAQDDEMLVEVSNDDGASWTQLETTANANSWQTHSFRLENFVALTDTMRLRVTVADEPNNDITEGLIDDLQLSTYSELPTLGTLGQAQIGQPINLYFDGTPNRNWTLVYSFQRTAGQTVGGVEGKFYMGNYKILQSGTLDGQGRARFTANVPLDAGLVGRTVHLQAVVDYQGSFAAFTNPVSLPIQ
jgi:murein tripeptide amidase MpaA